MYSFYDNKRKLSHIGYSIAAASQNGYSVGMSTVTTQVADFFAHYPLRIYNKGQILMYAQEAPTGVLYLAEGRVVQYDITPSGKEVVVNSFKPGAFFPMSWAINHTPNEYFFEAATAIRVHSAPAAEVVQFLHDNPAATFDLLARVYRGTDGVLRRMTHLMGGHADSRLQFELLNAAHRFGEIQHDGSVTVALNENDLARYSGLARETVNRAVQNLKAQGLVKVSRHNFIIPDLHKLETYLGDTI